MIWVTRGWQTVGRCSAKLANSWPVYDIDGKQLGNVSRRLGQLWRCWQIVGQSSAMLANSWADTCMHRPGNPHQCLWKFSIWRRAEWFWFFQYLCFLRISICFQRVTKRQSCSSIFSGWCRMQDLKRHIRRGPSWLCYRLFDFQHTSVQSRARISNLCHRTFRMESRPGCFRYFAACFSRASKVLEVWKFAFDSSASNLLCAF